MAHTTACAIASGALAALASGLAGAAPTDGRAIWDELYSTLSMTENHEYDTANGDAWSGVGVFGTLYDLQLADDFKMPGVSFADWFAADYLSFFGGTPANGMQVDIWSWTDSGPGQLVQSATTPIVWAEDFADPVFGLAGRRLYANVAFFLAPNTPYYVMLQAVDLSPTGDWYYQVRDLESAIGGDAYGREGDRGGGEQTDWRSMGAQGYGRGDTAMMIGKTIPGPATILVLAGAGIGAPRRRR